MAFKLKHLHLKTKDPQKAAKWWVANLGAKMVSDGSSGPLQISLEGLTMNVSGLMEGQSHPQTYGFEHVAIGVPNSEIKNVLAKLKASGAKVLEERTNPSTGRSVAFVETPDGAAIEVMGEA